MVKMRSEVMKTISQAISETDKIKLQNLQVILDTEREAISLLNAAKTEFNQPLKGSVAVP